MLAIPASTADYSPGAPGIGDPYYPTYGNGGYDVPHYDPRLTYPPEPVHVAGTGTSASPPRVPSPPPWCSLSRHRRPTTPPERRASPPPTSRPTATADTTSRTTISGSSTSRKRTSWRARRPS